MAANEEARFALNLEGNAAEHAAKDTAALEKLEEALHGDMNALRGMQAALRNLQGGAVVNIATMRQLKDQIAAQKARIATNTQAFVDMGGKFRGTKPAAAAGAAGIKELTEALKSAPGPVGALTSRLAGLGAQLAAGGGAIAIVAVLSMIAKAAIDAAVTVGKFALASADARRNELLHLDALTKLRTGYMGLFAAQGRAAMSGSRLQGIIDGVSDSVAIARTAVAGHAEALYKMGLRGANLQDALEGASIVAATQGDAAAQSFAQWVAGANATGQSVRRLTDDVRARLGPIAKAQMLSWNVQVMKLKENLAALFGDVGFERFMTPIKQFVDLFSQASATGRALKSIVRAIFGGVGEQLSPLGMVVKRFFQGMVIGALVAGIGLLRLRKMWRDTFGDSEAFRNIDFMKLAVIGGAAAVGMLVSAFATLAMIVAQVIGPLYVAAKALDKMITVANGAITAITAMKNAFKESGAEGGKGLAAGLMTGRVGVLEAARTLGATALKAFRDKLEIRSPSRALARLSLQGGAGVAAGLQASRPQVRTAARMLAAEPLRAMQNGNRLASVTRLRARPFSAEMHAARDRATLAPATPAAPPSRSAAAPRAGAVNVSVGPIHLTVSAASDRPEDIERAVERAMRHALADALRPVAVEIGAPLSGAA